MLSGRVLNAVGLSNQGKPLTEEEKYRILNQETINSDTE